MKDGAAGPIIEAVQEEFELTGLQMLHFTRANAAELLQVYQGVCPLDEYTGMVDELSSGSCIAFEVAAKSSGAYSHGVSIVEAMRELCGPADPRLARKLRPSCLRALFGGHNRARNAIHCTDLEEDGPLETSLVWRVLPSANTC